MDDSMSPDMDWPEGESLAQAPIVTSQVGSSHDPACDQCRLRKVRCSREYPKCSNCKKAKVPCSFSNTGKRVNHTTKLVNNVDILGKRMDKIERMILRWANATEQHLNATSSRPHSPQASSSIENKLAQNPPSSQSVNSDNDEIIASYSNSEEIDSDQQSSRHLVIEDGGHERYFASGSMYSIWAEIIHCTEDLLSSRQPSPRSTDSPNFRRSHSPQILGKEAIVAALDPSLQSMLQETRELLEKNSAQPPPEDRGDGFAPSLPPYFILENFIEPLLEGLNPILPIFARSSLLEAVRSQYETQSDLPDAAWATCFNNIIIQILAVKARPGAKGSPRNSIEESLKTTFLLNAQLSHVNLERLLKPRVANVQALLSMVGLCTGSFGVALVSLKHFRHSIFETLFSLACQVAKAVGLHQRVSSTRGRDTSDTERTNLFWTLFIIDKRLAMMCGQSPHLHSFDCDVPLPTPEATEDMPLRGQWIASIRLAFISESIYRDLYSAESSRVSGAQRERKVGLLVRKLDNWAAAHEHFWGEERDASSQRYFSSLELRYAMLSSRIAVLRRSKISDNKAQMLSFARESLALVKDMFQAPDTIASNVTLDHMLLHYPFNAFAEIYISITKDVSNASQDDINLLTYVAECINNQAVLSGRSSHIAKLQAATSLCSRVCTSIQNVKEFGAGNIPASGPFSHSTTFHPFSEPTSATASELGSWSGSRTGSPLRLNGSGATKVPTSGTLTPDSLALWETTSFPPMTDGAFPTIPDVMPTPAALAGKEDFSTADFQFQQYLAENQSAMMDFSNDMLETLGQTDPANFPY